ncbi:MAG: Histone deacetylase domain protein [Methanomassiliicoccales archaeon PtaU1.Bin124]|nr:MAG: Histone deacetylase domain protein [Methanomassiliicoccales archaeon PtaU1.Bin124]
MSGTTGFYYSDQMMQYYFGEDHPFQPVRYRKVKEKLEEIGAFGPALELRQSAPVKQQLLRSVHTRTYIDQVRELSKQGKGYLDKGDTPVTSSLYQGALEVTGATIMGVEAVAKGEIQHALNPAGGMHHAHPSAASGFCVFNDLAVATRLLQKKYGYDRIAIIDIDAHHGDGTQDIFYEEEVLTISLHRFGPGFYPCTGNMTDIGKNDGYGYHLNVPLPPGVPDEIYLWAYDQVVKEALDAFKPDFILHQFGTDAHFGDSLADLGLTTKAYERIAEMAHDLAHKHCDGKLVVTGGGGYNIDASVRSWALIACAVSGAFPYDPEALHHLQDSRIHPKQAINREEIEGVVSYLVDKVIPNIH